MTFSCNFTEPVLASLIPHTANATSWFAAFDSNLPIFEITTKLRVAAFLGQVFIESGRLTVLLENLNYSASGLLAVFPSHFNTSTATANARNPQAIANIVYGGRMGNTEPGDGWKFRGRGILQITGRWSYNHFSQVLFKDDRLVQNPDIMLTEDIAVKVAGAFWNEHKLNGPADTSDMVAITKAINGGTNELDQRLATYKAVLAAVA